MIFSRTTDITGGHSIDEHPGARANCEAAFRKQNGGNSIPTDEGDKRDLIEGGVKLSSNGIKSKLAL